MLVKRRFIPLLVLLIVLIAFFTLGFDQYLEWSSLKAYHAQLNEYKIHHPVQIVLAFMLMYVVCVAISVPGASFLTLVGGYLFGSFAGTIYTIVSATLGASILFIIMKTSLGALVKKSVQPFVQKLRKGFEEHAFNYLLVLRLIPLFPFWMVNIVPAILGIPFKTFCVATIIGILPGTFVYASLGSGLGEVLAFDAPPELNILLTPKILFPLLGLSVLVLLPVFYRYWRKKR